MPSQDRGRVARLPLGSIPLGELMRKLESLTPLGYGPAARVEVVLTITDPDAPETFDGAASSNRR